MAFRSTVDSFDWNTLAATWECPKKGLKKQIIDFKFKSMIKATEISKCLIEISDIKNLNNRDSNYLTQSNDGKAFWTELGTALTPVDRYIEIFLQQMFVGEKSLCSIETKQNPSLPIQFVIYLKDIEFINYLFRLNVKEMYNLALKFKENGVLMFKKNYIKFAHEYFCRSAKCLISFKPFDGLTKKIDGVTPKEMNDLLQTVQLNIAACLIKENESYENVIFLTQFVDDNNQSYNAGSGNNSKVEVVSDKAIYRRAYAFYQIKMYDDAKRTLEKIPNYKENKQLLDLYNKIREDSIKEKDKYKQLVGKMFASGTH